MVIVCVVSGCGRALLAVSAEGGGHSPGSLPACAVAVRTARGTWGVARRSRSSTAASWRTCRTAGNRHVTSRHVKVAGRWLHAGVVGVGGVGTLTHSVHTPVRTHARTHTRTHTHTHVRTQVRTRAFTHTHTHTHTQTTTTTNKQKTKNNNKTTTNKQNKNKQTKTVTHTHTHTYTYTHTHTHKYSTG